MAIATRRRKKASFTRNLTMPELEEPSAPDAAELPQRARATIGVGKETCYSSFREIYAMPVYPV